MAAKQSARRGSRTRKDREGAGISSKKILAVDIGGSKIKILATGQTKPRKIPSKKNLTPMDMVQAVQKLAKAGTSMRCRSVIPDWLEITDHARSQGTWGQAGLASTLPLLSGFR